MTGHRETASGATRGAADPGAWIPERGPDGGAEWLHRREDEHPVFDWGDQDLVLGDEDADWPDAGPGGHHPGLGAGGGPLRGGQAGDAAEYPDMGDDDVFLGYGDGEDLP